MHVVHRLRMAAGYRVNYRLAFDAVACDCHCNMIDGAYGTVYVALPNVRIVLLL